jgi:hypothetical protein
VMTAGTSTGNKTIIKMRMASTIHSLSPQLRDSRVFPISNGPCRVRRKRYGGPLGAATAATDQLSSRIPHTFGFRRQTHKLTYGSSMEFVVSAS